jgi:hypothetical protein
MHNEVEIPQFYYYLPSHYSKIYQFAVRILAMLSSTYLCEQLFSLMQGNKLAQKSKLTGKYSSSKLKIISSQIKSLASKNLFPENDGTVVANSITRNLRERCGHSFYHFHDNNKFHMFLKMCSSQYS